MLTPRQVTDKVNDLIARYAERDERMRLVKAVRGGDMAAVLPEYFNAEYDIPMVANWIDVVARDLTEAIAPLPALNCASGVMTTDKAKKFSSKRTRIASHYWQFSNLALQQFTAVDNFITYGYACYLVEPDYKTKFPRIRLIESEGTYPELDRYGDTVSLTRSTTIKAARLAAMYPDRAPQILKESDNRGGYNGSADLTVYTYVDATQILAFVKERENLILINETNMLGECPVVTLVRPTHDGEMRGQFDDVLGVQAARAIMMRLMVEGTQKMVQSPIAVPDDMTEISIGPDSIIRTANPQGVRRVDLSLPQGTFAESAQLQQELMTGARYPQGRNGDIHASIITGKGVEAMMGGFDSQIKTAQLVFAIGLRKITRLCFLTDEHCFGRVQRTIRGVVEGTPFEDDYTPARDIAGDYTCDVTYGFLAGLDPNRALVFLLQLRGDKLIDRSTVQRNMPFDVDLQQLQQNVDVEEMRDALKAGALAYAQAIGPIAQQGGDPRDILKIISRVIQGRVKGQALEDLMSEAFDEQDQAAQAAAAQQQQQQADQGGGDSGPGEVLPNGLMRGVAPGQAGMPPGGRPDVQQIMASMGASGKPDLKAGVRRMIPTQ